MNALGQQLAEYTISFLKSFGFDQLIGFAENVRTQVDAMQLQEELLHGMSISNRRRLEYNNPADKYKPSPQVETGAAIITEGGFYENTPVPQAPVGLLTIGLVAGKILCLIWLFRCCMPVVNCGPRGDSGVLSEEVANENKTKGRRIWIATLVFIIIVSMTDLIVFDGNSHFDNGVVTITDCIETLKNIFTDLYDACVTISLGASGMANGLLDGDCSTAVSYLPNGKSADMSSSIGEISTQMMTFSQLIARPLSELDNGKTALHLYGQEYREMAVMGIFAIVFVAIILLTLCHVFKWRLAMKFALAYTYIIYVLTVVFTFPFMVFVAILGVFW